MLHERAMEISNGIRNLKFYLGGKFSEKQNEA